MTQVYAAAPSCAYSGVKTRHWETICLLVLEAEYEATVWSAVLNRARGGARDVFLTFLGGGVFGNDMRWIARAIGRACAKAKKANADLNVVVTHYRTINKDVEAMVNAAMAEAEELENISVNYKSHAYTKSPSEDHTQHYSDRDF